MVDQMFPFLVKGRMEQDERAREESANLGPGSYSPHSNPTLINSTSSKVMVKTQLGGQGATQTLSYLDKASNKVIELGEAKKAPIFGSSENRFDQMER